MTSSCMKTQSQKSSIQFNRLLNRSKLQRKLFKKTQKSKNNCQSHKSFKHPSLLLLNKRDSQVHSNQHPNKHRNLKLRPQIQNLLKYLGVTNGNKFLTLTRKISELLTCSRCRLSTPWPKFVKQSSLKSLRALTRYKKSRSKRKHSRKTSQAWRVCSNHQP